MAIPVYPSTFREPERSNFGYVVDVGLIRTPIETGITNQRRRFTVEPHVFSITFKMNKEDFGLWYRWWMDNAYDWFEMPVFDAFAAEIGVNCINTKVRCITDLNIKPLDAFDYVEINLEVEARIDPNLEGLGSAAPRNNWIVAGNPPAPSADTFTAGKSATPSPSSVVAGTPAAPSAVV